MAIVTPPHLVELFARDNCTVCPAETPPCSCNSNEVCRVNFRSCLTCTTTECVPNASSGGSKLNAGVIAGPVAAVVVLLLIASVVVICWLRRKRQRDLKRVDDLAERARKGESSAFHLSTAPGSPSPAVSQMAQRSPVSGTLQVQQQRLPTVPAEAEYCDENGTTIRVYTGKRGVINADPNHPDNGGSGDPFADSRSMSTAGSGQSTNVIPIHYVGSDDGSHPSSLQAVTAAQQAAAARTLDLARQNLFRPRGAVPPRPARAPDLDLRLGPPQLTQLAEGNASRTSVGSFTSASPSFTSDVHLDVPQIVTRQQVHIGRLQTAEVVNISNLRTPTAPPTATDPFAGDGRPSIDSAHFDDGASVAQPSPTDLRFSMGSLPYDRTSVSTTGTRPPLPLDRPRFESISSAHSVGGASLSNYPMTFSSAPINSPRITPHNMSTTTLDQPPSGRPLTTASIQSNPDSIFSSYPFSAPPGGISVDNLPLPPPVPGSTKPTNSSRLTLGMSGMSDSFGGFDLNFEGSSAAAAAAAAGSTEHVHDPETPPAANTPAAKR